MAARPKAIKEVQIVGTNGLFDKSQRVPADPGEHLRCVAREHVADAIEVKRSRSCLTLPNVLSSIPAPAEIPPPLPRAGAAIAPADATRPAARCSTCAMRSICMPQGLSTLEWLRLDAVICSTRLVKQGEALYRTGDSFQSIYAVHAGSFKTTVMHRDGREQVTGFHLAGDALGFDGVSTARYSCNSIAIEDSNVCIIPFQQLESLCREVKIIQQHVHRMMSGEIVRESVLMMLLGTMSAEQRVAAFLLNLSTRLKARGYSPAEFYLRMTREEIGSYLGMKLENRQPHVFEVPARRSRGYPRQADSHSRSGRTGAGMKSLARPRDRSRRPRTSGVTRRCFCRPVATTIAAVRFRPGAPPR